MSRVVVISGHPNLEQSHANKVILEHIAQSLENVEIRRLDRLYPDFQIDVEAEQKALLAADVIVLQFPFYWYSVPALLKKWLDDTFSYNFAYGSEGDKLKGKDFILSFTIGGPEESYSPTGYNHFRVDEMMKPLEQTAYLAGMNYRPLVYTHRMVYIPGVYNKLIDVQARALVHAKRLTYQIKSISQSPEERVKRLVSEWFTEFDRLPEESSYFTDRLSANVNWITPQGTFRGHEGFRDWYAFARRTFKPGCDHHVEQLETTKTNDGYRVDLRIRMTAESYPESDLKGAPVNLLVNETWLLEESDSAGLLINDYQITVVSD